MKMKTEANENERRLTMANEGETVREVCDLIRIPRLDLFKTYDELADRILAAHEREMAAKDAEIARLKAALKPVMSCDVIFWEGEDPWYAENRTVKNASYGQVACTTAPDTAIGIANCHNAVREAQRVMREGVLNAPRH